MAKNTVKGRFEKGKSGNPKGRKPRAVEENYLLLFKNAVTEKDWKDIIDRAVLGAKRGDAKARQWLSDYLIGKPAQPVDLTAGAGPLKILIEYADNKPSPPEADSEAEED